MHWLKLLKNNLNQQLFKSKHLQVSYLEVESEEQIKSFRMGSVACIHFELSTLTHNFFV
jgi:hypothetical protein